MAHFILEHSTNLSNEIDFANLFTKLTQTAVDTGLFPLAGIRCRAHPSEQYRIASGNPDFGFIHLAFRIGTGRSEDEKQSAAAAIFEALSQYLDDVFEKRGLAVSFELTELPVSLKFNRNNIRDYL